MADSRWLGRAIAIQQNSTLTLTGTWVTGDTITLTINEKPLTLTIGTTVTVTQIAADIVDMWQGNAVNGTETRNAVGTDLAEYAEITATSLVGVVTFIHDVSGVPFTLVTSRVTASSGAVADATPQTATGPNDVNNAANWSEGSVPALADTVFIDNTDVSLLYNLDQLSGNTLTSFTVGSTFTGKIGLPKTNLNGYTEYRPEYLEIDCTTILLGTQEGSGSPRIKIDSGSIATTLVIDGTSSSLEDGLGAVIWKGTNVANVVQINNGSLSISPFGSEVATVATMTISGSSSVESGSGNTLTTINMGGNGTLIVHGSVTTINQDSGTTEIRGTGAVATLSVDRGICNYLSNGTITTLNLGGFDESSLVDLSLDIRARAITTLNMKRNGTLNDPSESATIGTLNKAAGVSSISAT